MVEAVQFRDYVFPHNPASITVLQQPGLAVHLCPGAGEIVQNLGQRGRTIRCQGSFWGSSYSEALAQLAEFRQRTADGARGMLLLPGMQSFLAYLSAFAFDAVGDGKVIPYTMEFTEAGEA